MFGYTRDYEGAFDLMDQLRRRMDRMLEEGDWDASFPRTNVYDTGAAFVLEAELPGVKQDDLKITLLQDVVTIAGERRTNAPEGYGVQRQERAPFRFNRSYSLPAKVDPEKVGAKLNDGVLTLTLEKAPEVKPRQISVKVG
ncbi:MAG: Hsp20/alpha crystallin family protein [Myxococcales bacterium]|nr:Hsp20/alpha crystallin family protein [Myxococcales bacterium]MCB9575803.1 Hsp20/alpha crystallin family protein [Polyangiaceae bacterium]